jgi:hypothetical protein
MVRMTGASCQGGALSDLDAMTELVASWDAWGLADE